MGWAPSRMLSTVRRTGPGDHWNGGVGERLVVTACGQDAARDLPSSDKPIDGEAALGGQHMKPGMTDGGECFPRCTSSGVLVPRNAVLYRALS